MKQYQLYVREQKDWSASTSLRSQDTSRGHEKGTRLSRAPNANHRIRLEQEEMEVDGELLDVETQELPEGPKVQPYG